MAKKPTTKKPPVEDDLLPPPKSALAADDVDEEEQAGRNASLELEGLPNDNRRTLELQAQMASLRTGIPIFPPPADLDPRYLPYWVELVNSFPTDHFQISDLPLMRMYVRCAYDIERITRMIDEEGEVVFGAKAAIVPNPRIRVRTDAQMMLLSLTTKFRNQPASRVNSELGKARGAKAAGAAAAGRAVAGDEDGLLAGAPGTRH